MDDSEIRVRAKIRLLTAEEGGRSTPLRGGGSYRPNHNFFDADSRDMRMGLIDLPDGQPWEPGQSREVEIRFLNLNPDEVGLRPGREWRIQEGGRLVGVGTIMRLLT
jgi:elongation factor Tu